MKMIERERPFAWIATTFACSGLRKKGELAPATLIDERNICATCACGRKLSLQSLSAALVNIRVRLILTLLDIPSRQLGIGEADEDVLAGRTRLHFSEGG